MQSDFFIGQNLTFEVSHGMVYESFPGPVLEPVAVEVLSEGGVLPTSALELWSRVAGYQHHTEIIPYGPVEGENRSNQLLVYLFSSVS